MFDIESLGEILVVSVIAACLIIGYIIKNYTAIPNKNIPLIMLLCGIIINIVITLYSSQRISPMTVIAGAMSGLASSGSYDLFSTTFGLSRKNKKCDEVTEEESEE